MDGSVSLYDFFVIISLHFAQESVKWQYQYEISIMPTAKIFINQLTSAMRMTARYVQLLKK